MRINDMWTTIDSLIVFAMILIILGYIQLLSLSRRFGAWLVYKFLPIVTVIHTDKDNNTVSKFKITQEKADFFIKYAEENRLDSDDN